VHYQCGLGWVGRRAALREATVKGGFVSAEEFDRVVDPQKMVGNPRRDLGIA
jgi:fumarate hydratase class II